MKRFLCLLLTAALLLAVPAAGSAASAPTLTVSETTGNVGDTVSVTVSLANNPGIIGFRFRVTYDAAVLELVDHAQQGLSGITFGPKTKNPFTFTWMDALKPDNTYNGAVIKLTFRVREGAPSGKSAITVTYNDDDVINAAFQNVNFAVVNGGVTVTGGSAPAPAEKVRHSVTERDDADRGLAFRFTVPVRKVQMTAGGVARTDNAFVLYEGTQCPLVRMGALVTADTAVGTDGNKLVRGAAGVTDVAATTVLEVDDTTCRFALRIHNIPDRATERLLYARSYYVIRYQGQDVTVYGAVDATTYRACRP
jgi:hypothetical protein